MKLTKIAAIKSWNIIYNTTIWTQLPKWMLDVKINLLHSTKVWIIPGHFCSSVSVPQAPLGHLKLCFFSSAQFCIHSEISCNKEVIFSIPSFHLRNYLTCNCSAYWRGWQRSFHVNKQSMSLFQMVQIGERKSDEGEK